MTAHRTQRAPPSCPRESTALSKHSDPVSLSFCGTEAVLGKGEGQPGAPFLPSPVGGCDVLNPCRRLLVLYFVGLAWEGVALSAVCFAL